MSNPDPTSKPMTPAESPAGEGLGARNCSLLPCPFCGGSFIPDHPKMLGMGKYTSQPKLEELTEGGWRVCCYGCGVQTWDNLQYTAEQAVAAWNTRSANTSVSGPCPPAGQPQQERRGGG